MKKLKILGLLLFSSCILTAQNDTGQVRNRRGHLVLPEKNDIAIGFNMIPVLDVLFRTINFNTPFSTSGNIVQYSSSANNQITGKFFLRPNLAVRLRFGINTLSGSITSQVQDAGARYAASLGTADDIAAAALLKVNDKLSFRKNNLLISIGIEKRRGYRRLQGFYGAELGFGNESASQQIRYGNQFSDRYEIYYTDFAGGMNTVTVSPVSTGCSTRELETIHKGGLRMGLRGFIGIEYFIFSKISVAAEYGWSYSVVANRKATTRQEVYNNGQNGPQVLTQEVETDSREVLRGFAIDNNSGSVFSMNNTLGGNTALNGGAGALTLFFHF